VKLEGDGFRPLRDGISHGTMASAEG